MSQEEPKTPWRLSPEMYYTAISIWLAPAVCGFLGILIAYPIISEAPIDLVVLPFLWFCYLSPITTYLTYRWVMQNAMDRRDSYRRIRSNQTPIRDDRILEKLEKEEAQAQGEQLDDDNDTSGDFGLRTRDKDRIRNKNRNNNRNRRGLRLPARKKTL